MRKTKIIKIIVAILIAITLFLAFSQTSLATKIDLDKFKDQTDKGEATGKITEIISKAINVTQVIGAGLAIIMLVVTGIRWIWLSPSGKAQMAKSIRYYVLGAIFIFAAIGLLQIVKNFIDGSVGSQT